MAPPAGHKPRTTKNVPKRPSSGLCCRSANDDARCRRVAVTDVKKLYTRHLLFALFSPRTLLAMSSQQRTHQAGKTELGLQYGLWPTSAGRVQDDSLLAKTSVGWTREYPPLRCGGFHRVDRIRVSGRETTPPILVATTQSQKRKGDLSLRHRLCGAGF